jgi:methylenetetrahydrofolate reductase (NADPH)
MSLLDSIRQGFFSIVVEFTPHDAAEARKIAEIARGLEELNKKYAAAKIVFAGVSLTQNPGGSLSYDHLASLAVLHEHGFPKSIELVPHITGKDMNRDALRTLLPGLAERGVRSILALTGDLSTKARGVFEVDSLGILQLVRQGNIALLRKAKSAEAFGAAPQITAGAAVSPFKYTEGALAMQYIKAAKKVREGAAFLVCQTGWDARRSEGLVAALRDLQVPIQGNVLVVNEAAARYMQTLAGCVVTDDFLRRLKGESAVDNLARAGRQLAMFRALGYTGIDLGKPGEFGSAAEIEKIVDGALATKDWREFAADITFAPPESPAPPLRRSVAGSRKFHQMTFEESGSLHRVAQAVLAPFNRSAEREGMLYRLFNALEGAGKEVLYECGHCGDCFLPENEYVCTFGGCEKGIPNPPCGDARPDGRCGNNENRVCAGESIYHRLLHRGALEEFKKMTLPPRNPELEGSASVLNAFFGRDHTARENPLAGSGLIQIAELLHASIPLPGSAMHHIKELGEKGFTEPNRGRLMIEELILKQAEQGADFLDMNIDALGAPNAPDLMRGFVRMVAEHGLGVPPCIDSSDKAVLLAGLDEWFRLSDAAAGKSGNGNSGSSGSSGTSGKNSSPNSLRAPIINSVPFMHLDQFGPIFDLRRTHEFGIVCLLVGDEGPLKSSDEMFNAAKTMFQKATLAGFQPEQIFFDCVTLGIASDGCMDAMGNMKPSHTHNSFHAIQRIHQDAAMGKCHAVLGVSNWVYGATKRRIGHIRSFIAVAQKFGLDAAIVDVDKKFGITPSSPELDGFVQMFVDLDGSEDSMTAYSVGMREARTGGWI